MGGNPKEVETLHLILLALVFVAYVVSAINPLDRFAWIGQTIGAVLLIIFMVILYPRFRFSNFAYIMVVLYVLLLFYGAHYTYSLNPFFNQLKQQFGWQRNYFDRVGHFSQGFVPAFLFKELYLKGGYVKRGKMATFIVIISCLGLSAAYELGEFALVKILNVPVDAVMGTQGDIFDSHWDMVWALIGASLATIVFGRFHDRQIDV
ncbi:DUF2238 domain-containing protein [Jeotgalibaca sp. A122]|uniref:DUF2238 domain-containing protein n=1 Tax=Jeotgalibaca sp. A122 TaxID=3457322 RepID=UPI003FD65532